jgi:hypothetical protein
MYAARAAETGAATELGTGQFERVTQDPKEWSVCFDIDSFLGAVYLKTEFGHGETENILDQNTKKGKDAGQFSGGSEVS